jgi:AraC-like DNA-binding protein
MTARYVHELFECEGTIFPSFVLRRRLDRALAQGFAAYTISAIAFECGFPICPSFNRVLRRIQSATPRIFVTRHFTGVSEGRTGLATCATKPTLLATAR